ncbi:MAG: aminotransferase class V-fold PLP-dependent enzyme [Candidatus Saccharibacteria bacterium]|nr:aminotransferase class V-fold PLP-dependent enzyme [Candidatus Saccharibacteria bacterium]
MQDFDYLKDGDVYFDAACQSLRPRPVIEALNRYYTEHNSCGERVKYAWGKRTDEIVEGARLHALKFLGLKNKEYFTSFTLNTTYGINLILNQIRPELFEKVMTSEIEHNSVFLPTMSFAEHNDMPREIMKREEDGSIDITKYDFTKALVVVNAVSNIDGRELVNLKELTKAVHKAGGVIILDAAQAFAHNSELLHKTEVDALCTSAHKMYAASLGVIVARRDLVPKLDTRFVGGGMVDDVHRDEMFLSAKNPDNVHTIFEAGLQAWGEIIAFDAALTWLEKLSKKDKQQLHDNCDRIFEFLKNQPRVHLLNKAASPTFSFYIDGLDSHLVGEALSDEGIMARTGYFCVHYYLGQVLNVPPLIRFSLGYHVREADVDKVLKTLERMLG